jgi:hypothetical protein
MGAAYSADSLCGENMCLPAVGVTAVEKVPKKWCLALANELICEGNGTHVKNELADCSKLGLRAGILWKLRQEVV